MSSEFLPTHIFHLQLTGEFWCALTSNIDSYDGSCNFYYLNLIVAKGIIFPPHCKTALSFYLKIKLQGLPKVAQWLRICLLIQGMRFGP